MANRKSLVFVNGWDFLKGSYPWEFHADNVRTFFCPKREYTRRSLSLMREIRESFDVVVGVHVRRRDYVKWRGGIYCYDNAIYLIHMREVEKQLIENGFMKVCFVLCSDVEIDIDAFTPFEIRHLSGAATPIEDLYLLSLTDYIIGPPSTFSMWASFYGKPSVYFILNPDNKLLLNKFSKIVAMNQTNRGKAIFNY